MDMDMYIRKVLNEHLLVLMWYKILSSEQAKLEYQKVANEMWNLIEDYSNSFTSEEIKYFNHHWKQWASCWVPLFYSAPKVHK